MRYLRGTPSRYHYLIGLFFIIGGFVLSPIILVANLGNIAPDIQCVVPGVHEVYLHEGGDYTVFYEYRSFVDGKLYSTNESISGMQAMLESKDTGQMILLSAPVWKTTYEVDGRVGTSVLEFTIAEPGTYIFTGAYDSSSTGPDIVLAIGQPQIMQLIIVIIAVILSGLIIGLLIIARTFIKRRKLKIDK